MSTNCLLMIKNDSPLNFAMEMLLVPETGIHAVKSFAGDLNSLINEICDFKSEVVILEDAATSMEGNSLTHLLMSNPNLKIIVVLRESNYIHIFRKDEILIRNASEFLDIIRSE